jgi:hypothetical protein
MEFKTMIDIRFHGFEEFNYSKIDFENLIFYLLLNLLLIVSIFLFRKISFEKFLKNR